MSHSSGGHIVVEFLKVYQMIKYFVIQLGWYVKNTWRIIQLLLVLLFYSKENIAEPDNFNNR